MKKILFGTLISLLFSFSASADVYGRAALKVINNGKIMHSEKESAYRWEFLVSYKNTVWLCRHVMTTISCQEINIE
jgi:hypothetical protein